jgi:hypothetical protein
VLAIGEEYAQMFAAMEDSYIVPEAPALHSIY